MDQRSEPTCQYDKIALYTCINKNCKQQNPFICTEAQCKCSIVHQICPQIRLKSLSKVFDRKDQIVSVVLQKINARTDQLIDQISDLREKIIDKLKNGKDEEVLGTYIDQTWLKQHESKLSNKITASSLNGELMSQIWSADQNIDEEQKHKKVIATIEETFNKFSTQIEAEFERIFKFVLKSGMGKFYWSEELKGSTQQISGKIVKKISGVTSDRFTLLEPSLTKLKAKKVQWTVRAIKVSGWVGLGVCIRGIVEKNKFDFINYTQAEHGSYIISSNGYTWAHMNPEQNSSTVQGVEILTGNQISFELDLTNRALKFTNKTNQRKNQLNIVCNLKENDDLHICSCLGSTGDEIEIIGDIWVDGGPLKWDQTKI